MSADPTRITEIRESIVKLLDIVAPHSMSEGQLRGKLDLALVPPLAEAEFDDALLWLSVRDYVRSAPDLSDETVTRWQRTRCGLNWLNER